MTTLTQTQDCSVKSDSEQTKGSLWTGTFLISGTCIGGGMLAMPVQTAEVGFALSFFGLFVCWIFMTFTGLLLIEATLWIKNETHFSSLSRILIGNSVKVIALIIYLFMNYASLVAYTAGGASIINMWTESFLNVSLGYEICCVTFTIIFGSIIFSKVQLIGSLNFWFMICLAAFYFILVAIGISSIKMENLGFRANWTQTMGVFSMILATFSYQMVVPSVCAYMNYDVAKLKKAVILGTTIPFFIYSLWIFVIHGAVALEGTNGLREAWKNGVSATTPLRMHLNHWIVALTADGFGFLAVVTSYFGLSISLFYFLKDCFNEVKITLGRNQVIFLSVIPTLFLALLFPRALLQFLDISGGFGDTILSGLIPIALVWAGRYRKKIAGSYTVPGGKTALILAACFFFGVLLLQFF